MKSAWMPGQITFLISLQNLRKSLRSFEHFGRIHKLVTNVSEEGGEVRVLRIKRSSNKMVMAALLTAIVLAACTPPKPAQQFTLRIGTFSAPSFLPYFVMQEQGFDKKNGLQLVEKSYPGGTAIIEAVIAGSLDMGVSGTPPVLSAAERGLIPSKVIPVAANDFADPDHPGVGVLVPLSVTSWQDLKGQQIAINALNSINAAPAHLTAEVESHQDGLQFILVYGNGIDDGYLHRQFGLNQFGYHNRPAGRYVNRVLAVIAQ